MGNRTWISAAVAAGAAVAWGCASAGGPPPEEPEPGPESPEATASLVPDYPAYRPVPVPDGYRRAVRRGTRTADGSPGPSYWQQEVNYRIRARLLPDSALVRGGERVEYVNRSPDTLRALYVHLYQNVFSGGVRRNRRVNLTGGLRLHAVTAQGDTLSERGGDAGRRGRTSGAGYRVRGTLARVRLPRRVLPGDTATLGFEWSFRVPGEDAFRTGRIGHDLYNVAQWYPQVAAYDDVQGHDATPYLGDGEFYLEYGTFDVSLEVPEGWLVTATGRLENAGEVLAPGALRRMRDAVSSDTVVAVVDTGDAAAGRATRDGEGGTLTWRYRTTRPARDFAFAASSKYVWDAVGAEVGGERGRVRVDALYDPALDHWREAAEYSRHSLEYFSDYLLPYPYSHAAAAYGPIGGMEYPALVFIGRSAPGEPLYGVLAHEFSHQWFPMMVGSKEAHYAWMDEGLTTYNESLAREAYFEDSRARSRDRQLYLRAARAGVEAPIMRHTDYVESGFGRGVAAYMKPGIMLHALRDVLGRETFDRAYREFAREWKYRHPYPWDFFRVFEEAAGRDLDWFWRPWFFETATLDQAVAEVTQQGSAVALTVENRGDAVMPVHARLTFQDSSTRSVEWPVDVWAGTRTVTRSVQVDGRVVRVELDPERSFPDLKRANNRWERQSR